MTAANNRPCGTALLRTRRAFLRLSGVAGVSAWLTANWPAIAAAAQHATHSEANGLTPPLSFFDAADAADVETLAAQIVPSGATPGAREARAVYFIDRALTTFYADWAPAFRQGLREFQAGFRAARPGAASFATAAAEEQLAFLKSVDQEPFFEAARTLTVLGLLAAPQYGGNYRGAGWRLIGFTDQLVFEPPFGYYDREYTGFVPYAQAPK
jgi:Gluconate 2-dehydrogenase subunit 3